LGRIERSNFPQTSYKHGIDSNGNSRTNGAFEGSSNMATILSILFVALQSSFVTAAPGFGPSPLPGKSGCEITPPSFGKPKTCTVWPLPGTDTDDTPNIIKAFEECNNGGTVVFPEGQNYWIDTKLNPVVKDVG